MQLSATQNLVLSLPPMSSLKQEGVTQSVMLDGSFGCILSGIMSLARVVGQDEWKS